MRDALFIHRSMGSCTAVTVRALGLLLLLLLAAPSAAQDAAGYSCAGDKGGITLPPGFCATVFADNVGHARQMVVAPNGVVYVNTWSGPYFRNDTHEKKGTPRGPPKFFWTAIRMEPAPNRERCRDLPSRVSRRSRRESPDSDAPLEAVSKEEARIRLV